MSFERGRRLSVVLCGLVVSGCAHGTLVTSTPPGATVTVGDEIVGVTPIEIRPTSEPIRVETADAITTFTMTTETDLEAATVGVGIAALAWVGVLSTVAIASLVAVGPEALAAIAVLAMSPGLGLLLPVSSTAGESLPRAGPREIRVDFARGSVSSEPPNWISPVPAPAGGTR